MANEIIKEEKQKQEQQMQNPYMVISPNQKILTIHKTYADMTDSLCMETDPKALSNAIQRMNGKRASGFIMWTILASNSTGTRLPISSRRISNEYGITKDQYDAGIRILIDSGFLVKNHGNEFDFFEYPESHKREKTEKFQENTKKRE